VASFEPAAAKKGIALAISAPNNLPNVVLDASWIESAITNLVANALRMTDTGGGARVTVEDHGAEVWISVSDDGPGIAPENHKKVFERFAQGDHNRRMVGGTGLGLVLVREAARLHGGDVTLTSDLGKGATFTLRLPRRPAGMASIAPPGSAARPITLPPPVLATEPEAPADLETPGPNARAPLALVVEDNPELLRFVADVLSVRYRVRTATNGADALVVALHHKPDVVVSDVAMSGMDGYELCRGLRANAETRTVPIVLVTARTDLSSVLTGFEAGANDYVLKPFHGRELLARVDVHVRVRRMVQELALQERHAMLGVLAASVAHQVRNPLSALVSGLPAMRKRVGASVDAQSLELIDVMIDCAERIERLTQDLLDLSRVDREEGGKYRPSDGLRAALRLFRTRAGEGVTIEDDIESSVISEGRVGDINHVFMNLLDNALRAIGERGTIRVRGKMQDGFYVTQIEDSGPGVDEQTAERIFEPFFTTREAGQGTGLGLAIARQVINSAGGTIEIGRSSLGGAVFTTRIPVTSRDTALPATMPS
jgi:signal transduction histidine kinase